jgi:hypothetical protein
MPGLFTRRRNQEGGEELLITPPGTVTITVTPDVAAPAFNPSAEAIARARGQWRRVQMANSDRDYQQARAKLDQMLKDSGVSWEQATGKNPRRNTEPISSDAPDAIALADFRGTGPKEILEFQDGQFQDPRDFYAIGQLCGLWTGPVPFGAETEAETQKELRAWDQVIPRLVWTKPYTVLLVADAHDTTDQLYLMSDPGEQELPEPIVEDLCDKAGVEYKPNTQYQSLGTCYGVGYEARKIFDDNRAMTYLHAFGEEDGDRPVLWYDRRRRALVLTGGNYRIDRKDAELGASPGIAN